MKGLKTWVLMGWLCLGLTLTVPMSEITQSSFSWSAKKRINTTNSFTISDFSRRHNDNNQVDIAKILRHHGQYEKMASRYSTISGSMDHTVMTSKEKYSVDKRSVKRGEVNYFENLTNRSTLMSSSQRQVFKKLNSKKTVDGENINLNEYGSKHPGNRKEGKMMDILAFQLLASKALTKLLATFRVNAIRPRKTGNILEKGTSRSNNFSTLTQSRVKLYQHLFIRENLSNGSMQSLSWECNELSRIECHWRRLDPSKRKNRHKRMALETSKEAAESKKERKQQIQEEAGHRRKESAVRRKEVRNEKLERTKTRRLQLKNSRKPPGRLHATERLSISEEMRKNREKVRGHEPKRPQSSFRKSAGKSLLTRGHTTKVNIGPSVRHGLRSKHNHDKIRLKEDDGAYGKKNCRKSIGKNHNASMNLQGKNCSPKGKKGDHKNSSKSTSKRKLVSSDEKSSSKSSSDIEIKSIKKKSKHRKQNSKAGQKTKGNSQDGKKKMDKKKVKKKPKPNHRKSKNSSGLHEKNVVSKSSSSHKGTGKSASKGNAKDGDKHSSKKLKSKKQSKNKKEHEKSGSKKKKSDKKKSPDKGEDNEERDKDKITHRKGGKLSNSKIKNSSKKHVIVVSEESEEESDDGEVNSGKHKYKKQDESKHSQGKVRKSKKLKKKNVGKGIKGSSAEKSSKHTRAHVEENSKSTATAEKSTRRRGEKNEEKMEDGKKRQIQKLKDESTKKHVSAGRSGNEKYSNEIEYMGHVLGFGLGKRKRPHSRTKVLSRRIHERPMTGGYASSGRLTRALSNLHGASASAGF